MDISDDGGTVTPRGEQMVRLSDDGDEAGEPPWPIADVEALAIEANS